jgi:hypothetical protein
MKKKKWTTIVSSDFRIEFPPSKNADKPVKHSGETPKDVIDRHQEMLADHAMAKQRRREAHQRYRHRINIPLTVLV